MRLYLENCSPPPNILTKPDIGEVHLWKLTLNASVERVEELCKLLSKDERNRAAKFCFARDSHRYIIARSILRRILGNYLGRAPTDLEFAYGRRGKPYLKPGTMPNASGTLEFNVTHSGDLALYAVSSNRAVGIDVEQIRNQVDCLQISRHFFAVEEWQKISRLPKVLQNMAFYSCWTRKEAYIKAHGKGFSIPLDAFEVSLVAGEKSLLRSTAWNPGDVERWTMADVSVGTGFAAALVVEGELLSNQCWNITSYW